MKPIWVSITKLGMVFGDFTVVRESLKGKTRVRCKCGEEREVLAADLHKGRRKTCGCEMFHSIGDIVNGRRLIARSTKEDSCVTVECLRCGHQAKVRAGYNESAACRNCEAFASFLETDGVVYTIVCPYTGDMMYVGATAVSIDDRLRDHIKSTRHPKKKDKPFYQWLSMLLEHGAEPGVITLEIVTDGNLLHREVFWIKKLRAEGYKLLNIDHNLLKEVES